MTKIIISLGFLFLLFNIYGMRPPAPQLQQDGKCILATLQEPKLIDMYRYVDLKLLQSKDEKIIILYLLQKNEAVLKYLAEKYPDFGELAGVNSNDPAVLLFGLVYAIAEADNFKPIENITTEKAGIPGWLRCVVDVCLGYFDIQGIINGLGTFEFGPVWKAVKSAIKKNFGFISAAFLLYDIATECLL